MLKKLVNDDFTKWYKELLPKNTTLIYIKTFTKLFENMFAKYCSKRWNCSNRDIITVDDDLKTKLSFVLDNKEHIDNICAYSRSLYAFRKTDLQIIETADYVLDLSKAIPSDTRPEERLDAKLVAIRYLSPFNKIYNSILRDIFSPVYQETCF